ncbi:KipI family sensor histidine kinase inhibitor [Herbihabitans rhizosphaerae]|uniref:KipI family sensor histidine kinase inhibitor n=1 Tax=Herbihabitans rhizosphaerae TaxID=1872711 RepID=A0A4Q7L6G1_9PSEU|nr:allophanate hydrolase subunit 1 [Herbihabitans rhizosphaerae]RZS44935.1 KipI family sensor histidine kinase inhibitor [Herbihabitans rhizosphaerae]
MRLLRCGHDAVLVEVDSLVEVDAVRASLLAASGRDELGDLVELVPAARTVLAAFRPGTGEHGRQAVREILDAADLAHPVRTSPREITLPVVYDGPDLALVADTAGLSTKDTVAAHTGAVYTVAFSGFAPGFGYLTGLPEPLRQPRLDSPRTSVPAGAVGVAGEFTGVYPRPSPGGWRLIGRLADDAEPLFDPSREPAALLAPGDAVRFEAAG